MGGSTLAEELSAVPEVVTIKAAAVLVRRRAFWFEAGRDLFWRGQSEQEFGEG